MAVAAAEQANWEQTGEWLLATAAFPESQRQASEQFTAFIGSLALRGEAMSPSLAVDNHSTLKHAIRLAGVGDPEAREVVWTNVAKDVGERLYKIGRSTVTLQADQGKFKQNGRNLTDIHRNTFEHTVLIPEMRQRSGHDTKNVFLAELLHGQGLLKTHDLLVWSTSSTKMTAEEKKDYNLFLDTESCSIQLFSASGNEIMLETAFVAGKATTISPRHDIAAIQKIAKKHGTEIVTDDGTEMMSHVMLIPKTDLPDGITDVVMEYDKAANGTFYGELCDEGKSRQDYLAFAVQCEQREEQFADIVERITNQLIAEAPAFDTPLEAIMRLDELSEWFCVKHAIRHKEINETIFGPVAAMHIEEARFFEERGEHGRAEASMKRAQQTAISGSCPLFKKARNSSEDNTGSGDNAVAESKGKAWMKCPHCSAKVYADPCASVLKCWDCQAKVVNGITYKGNGGSKARVAKKAAEEKRFAELVAQVNAAYAEKNLNPETVNPKARVATGV